MTAEQTIPLNQLVLSKANVRRTAATDGIGELAASIAAHGLRQNLNVMPSADGRHFEVVAGGRRLRALKMLAKQGRLAKDAPVNCLLLGEGEDGAEISLAENTLRTAMHPDDQFEAFRALIDKGASVEDAAARFGVTPAVVRQRLKLANVSPKLRALFRKGEMGLEHVMALAIGDDHKAQEDAWKNLPEWNRDPETLKNALTEGSVPLSDRLAKFIGEEAYQGAGGAIVRDLFAEEGSGFLSDRALVLKLAAAKLDGEAEAVRAEGWKWVRCEATRDRGVQYGRIGYDFGDEDEEESLQEKFSAEDRARAGAMLRIGYHGELEIERGLIAPEDRKAEAKRQKGEAGASTSASGYSAALVEDLTAHRTAALRLALARNPSVALAMTVHALASSLLYFGLARSCLVFRAGCRVLDVPGRATDDSPAYQAMADEGTLWEERLPKAADELMTWCLGETQETLLALLAFLAALSVDAVKTRQGRSGAHDHADRLAATLSLDMREWWTPSVEGFFGRLPKAALVRAVTEAGVVADGPFDSAKKADAARMAAKALKNSGWLPEPLRVLS